MVLLANRLQVSNAEAYSFDAGRVEPHSPTATKQEHRGSLSMHDGAHASSTLRSNQPLGAILDQYLSPHHEYALVALTPDGQYEAHLSQGWHVGVDQLYSPEFRSKLQDGYVRRSDYRSKTMPMAPRTSFASEYSEYQDDTRLPSRKRMRTRSLVTSKSVSQTTISIGDRQSVRAFYERCFKDFQQQGCKIFGKAWVKMMEPKKQSNHPYVKGNATGPAPPWWPPTDGPKDVSVRHKEPDHLGKAERIILFCHILEIIVDPHHPNRPKREPSHAQDVSIAELEAVTESSLADFYAASQKNLQKRCYMQDLFAVAYMEERCRQGQLSADHPVLLPQGPRTCDVDLDDEDERDVYGSHNIGASGMATPDTMVSAHDAAHFIRPEAQGVESYGGYAGMRENPYRGYGGQLPPTPEDAHYAITTTESYPPQPAPITYQSNINGPASTVNYADMSQTRRPSWQHPEYNPTPQLPPMNQVWQPHGPAQVVSPNQMNPYGGWSAPPPTLLPPMQPSMHEQQTYQENGYMKLEPAGSQQS